MAKKIDSEKARQKAQEKARARQFIDKPFFETKIKDLKRSPSFVPGRPLKEQIELDKPSRRKQSGGVRRVKG